MSKTKLFFAIIAVAILATVLYLGKGSARVAAGYKAKILCSEIFVAGRNADAVAAADFNNISPALRFVAYRVDHEDQTVEASLLGLGRSKAKYRGPIGCTLFGTGTKSIPDDIARFEKIQSVPFPTSLEGTDKQFSHIDYASITQTLNDAFADETDGHRAIVVIVDGHLVAERYAEGFSKETPFLSWSMAKSILATFIGAATDRNLLAIHERAPVSDWAGDDRANITWENLLHMQSGLAFEEDYTSATSDVINMLYRADNMAAVTINQPASHDPGQRWYYSSGETNLLARLLQDALKENKIDLQAFARETIFKPLGAGSFVLETDSMGGFVGSSYVYATPRDWAKVGQLYLQNGRWNGTQILSPEWIEYIQSPAENSDRQYGAHFWLNKSSDDRTAWFQGLPEDAYFMAGHDGQYVIIIPSKNAVIVRTGITRHVPPIEVTAPVAAALFDAIGTK